MSLSHRQQHQLHRIETGLLRSDPQFTAMLGIFGRLSAGKAMPAWEQVPTRQQSIRQAASLTVKATIVVAEALVLLLRAVLALVIVVAGPRHRHRLPAPGPERTRRGRGAVRLRSSSGSSPAHPAHGQPRCRRCRPSRPHWRRRRGGHPGRRG